MLVTWEDAAGRAHGWQTTGSARRATTVPVMSAGFLIFENRRRLVLAQNIAPSGDGWHVSDLVTIPRAQVTRRMRLRG